ncbi:PGDYG domain-containing protein [Lactobacillus sp. 3B(2020)]|nr:PGDYG domain-containing protein [Lactobacillus sp. 3B(2020)]
MIINPGDWILTGVDGEHWAVKDEIFNKTYKKVEE